MNERIKELMAQAGMVRILDEHAHEYGNGQFENTEYPELEKFAELIVRECVDHLEVEYGQSALTGNAAAKSVKKCFGVEE